MEIDLKKLKSSQFNVEDYVFLQLIYEGENLIDYKWSNNTLEEFLEYFQDRGYFKVLEDDTIEPRQLLLDMFSDTKFTKECEEIIKYLNTKLEVKPGEGFRPKTESNQKFIRARLKEGYTLDDMKKVVDTMVTKWKGTGMEVYLRPETLWNSTKFQTYINEARRAGSGWSNIV